MFKTHPEPWCDIAAQIQYMLDTRNGKDAVFIAAGNEDCVPAAMPGVIMWHRAEGTLLTTSREKFGRFATLPHLTDENLAGLLGYPQPKRNAMLHAPFIAAQVRDADDCVVKEAVLSTVDGALDIFRQSRVPEGGRLVVLEPLEVLQRRQQLRGA